MASWVCVLPSLNRCSLRAFERPCNRYDKGISYSDAVPASPGRRRGLSWQLIIHIFFPAPPVLGFLSSSMEAGFLWGVCNPSAQWWFGTVFCPPWSLFQGHMQWAQAGDSQSVLTSALIPPPLLGNRILAADVPVVLGSTGVRSPALLLGQSQLHPVLRGRAGFGGMLFSPVPCSEARHLALSAEL